MTKGPAETVELAVDAGAAGTRLDAWLAGAVADLGRNRAKKLILDGHVAIGGATIVEPKRPVKPGERVVVDLPPPEPPSPPPRRSRSPSSTRTTTSSSSTSRPAWSSIPPAGNRAGTLVNALIAHCGASLSGIGGVARPGIVHRLDKDTTGLMVVAKTDRAHRGLAAQFADHGRTGPLERGYLALVWGAPDRPQGTIDAPLGRSTRNREKIAVKRTGGREAVTQYRVEARFGPGDKPPVAALVECRLETGRTHQIRVHLAAIGHPVVGDRAYGSGFATKAALLPEPARGIVTAFPAPGAARLPARLRAPGNRRGNALRKPASRGHGRAGRRP